MKCKPSRGGGVWVGSFRPYFQLKVIPIKLFLKMIFSSLVYDATTRVAWVFREG